MSDEKPWRLGFQEDSARYEAASQNARVWTESWIKNTMYCPNCGAQRIRQLANNNPGADFECETCSEEYELKSQKTKFSGKVVDGAYGSMSERLTTNKNPNLILLNYDLARLTVTNLIVVPKHFFTLNLIERRKPLAATARRAGWIGCNILVRDLPQSAKISVLRDEVQMPKELVLQEWRRTLFLRDESLSARGWLIEVMKCVEAIGARDFSLGDVYKFEDRLARLYPENMHVKQKIRQQLQVLRDGGFLEFLGQGRYRLRSVQSEG